MSTAEFGEPTWGKFLPCSCLARPLAKHGQTFVNFEPRPGTETALVAAQEFSQVGEHPWLLLTGPFGTGKSHLMKAIGVASRVWPVYVGWVDLLEHLKAHMEDNTWQEIMGQFQRCDLLLLDDLGAGRERATPWAVEQTFRLLDYRYQRKLRTAVATNLSFNGVALAFDGRIASRLFDQHLVRVIGLTCPDYRTGRTW